MVRRGLPITHLTNDSSWPFHTNLMLICPWWGLPVLHFYTVISQGDLGHEICSLIALSIHMMEVYRPWSLRQLFAFLKQVDVSVSF